ncbi:RHS repeat-associated core domain-containing protein [Fictibacillus macauensis ZFHKF-1]|uniref:RHS repeat-associated core domain-containing protein n=1 Tax=Fictibacillus macauensis ZFHKF-1 TaxID=1196324 RepID=I8AGE9_9BACL|nr:AHH domain-containing protein [Fictibacillus macauensis]EIT84454.1 RHS repeat-associated core domain-containing protein [Fictibacillus macauensis ZFHKF-1]
MLTTFNKSQLVDLKSFTKLKEDWIRTTQEKPIKQVTINDEDYYIFRDGSVAKYVPDGVGDSGHFELIKQLPEEDSWIKQTMTYAGHYAYGFLVSVGESFGYNPDSADQNYRSHAYFNGRRAGALSVPSLEIAAGILAFLSVPVITAGGAFGTVLSGGTALPFVIAADAAAIGLGVGLIGHGMYHQNKVHDTMQRIDSHNVKPEVGGSKGTNKPLQKHHYATNKSKKYTPQIENITKKYDLDLDEEWNKELLPHQRRHPYAYHDYVLDELSTYDRLAKGDRKKFLKLFEGLKQKVRENPDMLYKEYWRSK